MFLIMIPLNISNSITITSDIKDATILQNSIRLYTEWVEIWNCIEMARISLFYGLLFGNSAYLINGKTPFQTYLEFSQDLIFRRTELYSSMKSWNFGNYSTNVVKYFSNYSYCENFRSVTKFTGPFENCGQGPLAFLDNNIIVVLKGLFSGLDEAYQVGISPNYSRESLRQLLRTPRFKAIFSLFNGGRISDDIYYLVITTLMKHVEDIIGRKAFNKITCGNFCTIGDMLSIYPKSQFLIIFNTCIIILSIWPTYIWVARAFTKILRYQSSISILLTPKLIFENPLLRKHLKK
jgi:hypothetical protein